MITSLIVKLSWPWPIWTVLIIRIIQSQLQLSVHYLLSLPLEALLVESALFNVSFFQLLEFWALNSIEVLLEGWVKIFLEHLPFLPLEDSWDLSQVS